MLLRLLIALLLGPNLCWDGAAPAFDAPPPNFGLVIIVSSLRLA